jgi:hypothetical protein
MCVCGGGGGDKPVSENNSEKRGGERNRQECLRDQNRSIRDI